MAIHPWTNYEIARLRHEERLLRGRAAMRVVEAREVRSREPETGGRQRTASWLNLTQRNEVVGDMKSERRAIMRSVLVICFVAIVAGAGVSMASAARIGTGSAWTESKAEQIVIRDATVRLSSAERVSLEDELRRAVALFRGLELRALDEGDESARWTYQSFGNRYQWALQSVRSGLRIDDADCTGSGRAIGDRFRQFHCLVTSEVLRIPSAQLDTSDSGRLPAVVDGQPREMGPFFTQFRVNITGKSTIAYRQVEIG